MATALHGAACVLALAIFSVSTVTAQPILDPVPELQRQDRQRQDLRERIESPVWNPSYGIKQTPEYQRLRDEHRCVHIERIEIQGQPS